MTLDILTYRMMRLWRVVILGVSLPLATVWLASAYHNHSFPLLTLLAVLVPTAHVLRYPGNWQETVTVSFVLSVCLVLASTMGPELSTGQVVSRTFWLLVLALILFFVLTVPASMLLMAGPVRNVRAVAKRRSTLDAVTLKREITHYPGRVDERKICGEADENGLFPVTLQMEFQTVDYVIEGCEMDDTSDDEDIDEDDVSYPDFHALVHSSSPDRHEIITYVGDGVESDEVGAVTHSFKDLGKRGTEVTVEETGHSLPLAQYFGFWLTDFMADHLTDEIDRAEGRPRRANRAFVHNQLVVDLANLMLPFLGGRKVQDASTDG